MEDIDEVLERWMEERDSGDGNGEWTYDDIVEVFKYGIEYGMSLASKEEIE